MQVDYDEGEGQTRDTEGKEASMVFSVTAQQGREGCVNGLYY